MYLRLYSLFAVKIPHLVQSLRLVKFVVIKCHVQDPSGLAGFIRAMINLNKM